MRCSPSSATYIRLTPELQKAQSWLTPVTMSDSSGQSSPRARPRVCTSIAAWVESLLRMTKVDSNGSSTTTPRRSIASWQLAVVGARREAVADQEEVARRGELRPRDEQPRVIGNVGA